MSPFNPLPPGSPGGADSPDLAVEPPDFAAEWELAREATDLAVARWHEARARCEMLKSAAGFDPSNKWRALAFDTVLDAEKVLALTVLAWDGRFADGDRWDAIKEYRPPRGVIMHGTLYAVVPHPDRDPGDVQSASGGKRLPPVAAGPLDGQGRDVLPDVADGGAGLRDRPDTPEIGQLEQPVRRDAGEGGGGPAAHRVEPGRADRGRHDAGPGKTKKADREMGAGDRCVTMHAWRSALSSLDRLMDQHGTDHPSHIVHLHQSCHGPSRGHDLVLNIAHDVPHGKLKI